MTNKKHSQKTHYPLHHGNPSVIVVSHPTGVKLAVNKSQVPVWHAETDVEHLQQLAFTLERQVASAKKRFDRMKTAGIISAWNLAGTEFEIVFPDEPKT